MPLFRRDQVRGTTQEAIVVLPHASARAFISLQNTTADERVVRVDVETERGAATLGAIVVPPLTSQKLALDAALARAGARDAASIRVINSGGAGDIVVAGAVIDPQNRYAGRVGATKGTFAVRGAHGSGSAFRLERLMITATGLTAEPGFPADEGPVMYVDVDGDERVLWIRTDTSDPDEPEHFPPAEDSVTLDLATIARWSSGTATTDETDTTEYISSSQYLSIRQPPSPQVTAFISIYDPPSIAELIARFYDPCANNYMLTFQIRISSPLSAYQITGIHYPICDYRPTCLGTCTTPSYTTIAATQTCTPPGQPFVQCAGLAINGRCYLHNFVCLPSPSPGICN